MLRSCRIQIFLCVCVPSCLDKLRRSMPSLVRVPSMPSVPNPPNHTCSPPQLRNSQSFDSSNGLARLQGCSESLPPVLSHVTNKHHIK